MDKFISEIKSGNDSILTMIGFSENDFEEVSYSEILENPSDIASGVTNVKVKFNAIIFDAFDKILIKEHDNGDVKYIFYTTTTNQKRITEIKDIIFNHLGLGYCDSSRHDSFLDTEKIKNISIGKFDLECYDLVNIWPLEKVTVLLQYTVNPPHQFSLFVTKHVKKTIDRSIRRNNTILDLIKNNPFSIIRYQEDSSDIELDEGKIKFIDYHYTLQNNELDIFDKLKIRQFGEEKDNSFKIPTSLTYTISKDLPTRKMMGVVEKLITIYGEDDGGTSELDIHEVDLVENKTYWTGRSWSFNESHGIWNHDNPEEKFAYMVTIEYNSFETGFTLTILNYNSLLDLFSVR